MRTDEHLDHIMRTQPWVCGAGGLVQPQVRCMGCSGHEAAGPVQCLRRELLSVRSHLT